MPHYKNSEELKAALKSNVNDKLAHNEKTSLIYLLNDGCFTLENKNPIIWFIEKGFYNDEENLLREHIRNNLTYLSYKECYLTIESKTPEDLIDDMLATCTQEEKKLALDWYSGDTKLKIFSISEIDNIRIPEIQTGEDDIKISGE